MAAASANDENHCFVVLFVGACGSSGGVYKISADWYTAHEGGPFGEKRGGAGTCGNVIEHWPTVSGGHVKFSSDLAASADLVSGDRVRAVFVTEFVCK